MSWILIILQLAVPIMGWVLGKVGASDATKRAFFEWVKKAADDLGSVRLMKYADEQLKWFSEHPFEETKGKKETLA